MTQYKFRGKRISNGQWVVGYYLKTGSDRHYILTGEDHDVYPSINALHGQMLATEYFFEVDPLTVGQFLRTSELGENIYEGDILEEDPGAKSRFEVVWDYRYSKYKLDCTRVCNHIQYPEWNRGVRMKIIGNVYDNPELVKPAERTA